MVCWLVDELWMQAMHTKLGIRESRYFKGHQAVGSQINLIHGCEHQLLDAPLQGAVSADLTGCYLLSQDVKID